MADILTTQDLIDEVRDQADEYNTANKDDPAILRMINRGQRFVTSQLVRTYQEPLLARATLDTSEYNATTGIEMPKDAFEDRLEMLWVDTPTSPVPLNQRTYRQIAAFNNGQSAAVPNLFYIRGRNIVTVPPIQSTYNLLVDYVRDPDKLVLPLGRISAWELENRWVIVRDLDTTAVSTEADALESFVNIIDGLTGLVKCTLQVSNISGDRLTFRSVSTYATVYGRTVTTDLTNITVTSDDYVCPASGTCIPQFGNAFVTYLVEYAVAALGRSLGDAQAAISSGIADKAQKAAEQQTAGRTNTRRVKNRSKVWGGIPYAGFPYTRR
jgi:hypothetical protein